MRLHRYLDHGHHKFDRIIEIRDAPLVPTDAEIYEPAKRFI